MDKKKLSERDICTKFITPALQAAGWDTQRQMREEVGLNAGQGARRHQATATSSRKHPRPLPAVGGVLL